MLHTKILVVDDEPEIAEELTEFLESCDFPCASAFSAGDALSKISDDPSITLVMTDMRMPGQDGAALIKELKEAISPPMVSSPLEIRNTPVTITSTDTIC